MMMNSENRKILLWLLAGLLVGGGIYYAVYANKTSGVARILLKNIDSDTKVFVDNDKLTVSRSAGGEDGVVTVAEGPRDVLVSKDGFWPWLKRITVASGKESVVYPFLVSKEPATEKITGADSEYEKLVSLINANSPATAAGATISRDNKSTVWVEDGTIYIKWLSKDKPPVSLCPDGNDCPDKVDIFESKVPIRNVDFLKSRNDVVIISAQNGIFAFEADKRGTQNFEPIYTGTDPKFYKAADSSLYVLDAGELLHIPL